MISVSLRVITYFTLSVGPLVAQAYTSTLQPLKAKSDALGPHLFTTNSDNQGAAITEKLNE